MSATYAPCFANGFHTITKGAHTLAWGREFRIGERRLLGENIAIAWKLQSELLQRRFWVDSIMNTGSNELWHRSDLIFAEDNRINKGQLAKFPHWNVASRLIALAQR